MKSNIAFPLISIMHTNVEYIDACLDILDEHWQGLVGVYAHTGQFEGNQHLAHTVMPAEEYARHVDSWLQRKIHLVGGCCGIGVAHIAALREVMRS